MAKSLRRAPATIHAIYAELDQQVQQDALDAVGLERGAYVPKTVKGRTYWYFQESGTATRRQRYIGPETPELLDKIAGHRVNSEGLAARRQMVAQLRRAFPGPDRRSGEALQALAEEGVFRLRGVLVGTAAFQAYMAMLGIRASFAHATTADIDIAQFRDISLAVKDQVERPMAEILVERGMKPAGKALQKGSFAYVTADRQFRVEFLTTMRQETDKLLTLPALKTEAQPLRFMDFLIRNEVPATALHGAGIAVNVPDPVRFALHKLIVSQRRTTQHAKSAKDRQQAHLLLEVLLEDRPYDVGEAWRELKQRGKKWRELALAAVRTAPDPVLDFFKAIEPRYPF